MWHLRSFLLSCIYSRRKFLLYFYLNFIYTFIIILFIQWYVFVCIISFYIYYVKILSFYAFLFFCLNPAAFIYFLLLNKSTIFYQWIGYYSNTFANEISYFITEKVAFNANLKQIISQIKTSRSPNRSAHFIKCN